MNHQWVLLLCGDVPLIKHQDLELLFNRVKNSSLDAVIATFETANPKGYGRIIKAKGHQDGLKIVEEKNLTEEEKLINEVNSGLYIFRSTYLVEKLKQVKKNPKSGEYYLTDVFDFGDRVETILFKESARFTGVNTLVQWEAVRETLTRRKIRKLRENGVLFLNSHQILIDWDVQIGGGSILYPNIVLEGKTTIGEGVKIETGACIKNCQIEREVTIKANSYLEDSKVHTKAQIGPFAHLRPGSEIGKEAKVGNFVELKKAKLGQGVKVSHLSYLGDCEVGDESNIGCGFITCNYDGVKKHKTKIGKNSFIGSDCQAIAPIDIGNDTFIAAGTTITKSVPDEALAIARAQMEIKPGLAKKYLKKKKD